MLLINSKAGDSNQNGDKYVWPSLELALASMFEMVLTRATKTMYEHKKLKTTKRFTMADEGFETLPSRKSKKRLRICVTNFTPSLNLEEELVKIFQQAGISISPKDIEHHDRTDKPCYIVTCESPGLAISALNGKEHNGRNILVTREVKPRPEKKGKSTFGAMSWAKPTVAPMPTAPPRPPPPNEPDPMEDTGCTVFSKNVAPTDKSRSVAIASTATMALLASMEVFGADFLGSDDLNDQKTTEVEQAEPSLEEFKSKCKKPLSQLLSDYGEQDLDFKNKKIEEQLEEDPDEDEPPKGQLSEAPRFQSMLGQHGKSPIHVELTSFGYSHRAPTMKNFSHAHPLQPIDCRHLHETPYWLVRPDGRNPSVKRAILNDETRQLCRCIANQVMDALQEAVEAGFGHAMPLRMSIYAGSEVGRHRSVVVCEATGIILRKLLRTNEGNSIAVPVSVGTLHRDIDRRQPESKQRADREIDEMEWLNGRI
jgi:hypothetical protein